MWSESSSPGQEHYPEQTQHCAHWAWTGCSWLGARMDSITGLVRCTRRWLQKYLSMSLSGRDTTSSMLSSWICCVNMFSSCGLLLALTQSWWYSATNSFDGTQSFGSLGSLSFSLDLHKRFRKKFKCGQKIGKGSYVPVPKDAGYHWLHLTLGARKFPSNFTAMNF